MQPLRSVEEAAGLLRISKWTVRGYIKAGKLQAVKLGRRVLLEESELERLVANGKTVKNDQTKPVPQSEQCAEAGGEGA